MTGSLSVLNVGAGDITITFNNDDLVETNKALGMLKEMLKRGYLIAIQLPDGSYTRAREIDAMRGRYIIVIPDTVPAPPQAEPVHDTCACGCGRPVSAGKRWVRGHHNRGRGVRTMSVPVSTSTAIGVGRSAGG
jgi:hypothetical protein